MNLVWLLACAPVAWTPLSALAPHRARLDADGDARVSPAEYARTQADGPPFADFDADGDDDLSTAELLASFRAQSPTAFDGPATSEDAHPGPAPWRLPDAQRDVWEVLVWMGDALRSAGEVGADPVAVDAALRSGRIDSAESRAVLRELEPRWRARGWPWPKGLPTVLESP